MEFAVAFIDIVMETEDAGLLLIKDIREMGFKAVRLIIRTGQPGYAPERDVIINYDINDYKTKADLTKLKLLTVLVTAIRSYRQLLSVMNARKGLELIVSASVDLFRMTNIEMFANGILTQITSLLGQQTSGFVATLSPEEVEEDIRNFRILCASGNYKNLLKKSMNEIDNSLIENMFYRTRTEDIVSDDLGNIS